MMCSGRFSWPVVNEHSTTEAKVQFLLETANTLGMQADVIYACVKTFNGCDITVRGCSAKEFNSSMPNDRVLVIEVPK